MNIINQAIVYYLGGSRHDVVIKVNITSIAGLPYTIIYQLIIYCPIAYTCTSTMHCLVQILYEQINSFHLRLSFFTEVVRVTVESHSGQMCCQAEGCQ